MAVVVAEVDAVDSHRSIHGGSRDRVDGKAAAAAHALTLTRPLGFLVGADAGRGRSSGGRLGGRGACDGSSLVRLGSHAVGAADPKGGAALRAVSTERRVQRVQVSWRDVVLRSKRGTGVTLLRDSE